MWEFTFLTSLILGGGVLIGFVSFRNFSKMHWVLLAYLIIELLLEQISRYFGTTGNRNNLIFLSVSGLIDVVFYTLFYQLFLFEKRRLWLGILSGSVLLLLLWMGMNKSVNATIFNSYDKVISNALVVLYAIVSSFDLISGKGPVRKEVMRINAAVLLAYSLDILFSMTFNFLINVDQSYVIYFFILRVAFIQLLYFIFGFTLWKTGKNLKR